MRGCAGSRRLAFHLFDEGRANWPWQIVVKILGSLTSVLSVVAFVGCGIPAETQVAQVTASRESIVEPPATTAPTPESGEKPEPQLHTVQKAVASDELGIPKVFLSSDHSAKCRVRVGDKLPTIKLPQLSGGRADLALLQGGKATVVLFWQDDPWMSAMALKDLADGVASIEGVTVVGIAVKQSQADVEKAVKEAGASFPQLLDNDGKAFGQVGMVKLPRVYVFDSSGKIVWFDIEYSQATHREMMQTLKAVTAD